MHCASEYTKLPKLWTLQMQQMCFFFSFCNSVKSPSPFYSHYKGFPGGGYIAVLCTQTLAGLVLLNSKYYGAYLQLVYTVTSHLKSMEL